MKLFIRRDSQVVFLLCARIVGLKLSLIKCKEFSQEENNNLG